MALSEIVVCDMALARLGVGRALTDVDGTLANSTDTSQEKALCSRWFERCRNSVLEAHPWTFARKFATLTLADDGTGEVWTDEWANAYTYPSDCLVARRFVNDSGAGYYHQDPTVGHPAKNFGAADLEWPFVVRIHAGAKVILTDVEPEDADLEYTFEASTVSLWTEQFADCLAWRLAGELAMPLSIDVRLAQAALAMYRQTLQQASAIGANEEADHPGSDGEFMRSRGGW